MNAGQKKHYRQQYHADLSLYTKIRIPLIPAALPAVQKVMALQYAVQCSGGMLSATHFRVPSSVRCVLFRRRRLPADVPCILFLHGGGFAYNAAPYHFMLARRLARETGYAVVMADYRLAPENPFPAAPQDCLAVYRHLLENAGSLRIDPARIVVMGDSAGGNLAAVLCRMAKDVGLPMPCAQMLFYPVTDRRMNTESYRLFRDAPMCSAAGMAEYFRMYDRGGLGPRQYLSPLEADSFAGLPPAYVEVAEFDCLRDEGAAYAAALRRAGVPVELYEVMHAPHGYDIAVFSGIMKKIMKQRKCYLEKMGRKKGGR